jgi:hypothetical protein
MLLMRWVQSIAALPAVLVFLSAANTYAEEEEKEKDTYTIELVSANEEGEIIDEFTMLAEDAMVESAARHKPAGPPPSPMCCGWCREWR